MNEVFSDVMPWTSLSAASWFRNLLLSIGLVGSWFFSCASISVRKSAPPRLVALAEFAADVPAPAAAPVPYVGMLFVLIVMMIPLGAINGPWRWF